jgi:hypothetical protein
MHHLVFKDGMELLEFAQGDKVGRPSSELCPKL